MGARLFAQPGSAVPNSNPNRFDPDFFPTNLFRLGSTWSDLKALRSERAPELGCVHILDLGVAGFKVAAVDDSAGVFNDGVPLARRSKKKWDAVSRWLWLEEGAACETVAGQCFGGFHSAATLVLEMDELEIAIGVKASGE
jgi:hypothetical protein